MEWNCQILSANLGGTVGGDECQGAGAGPGWIMHVTSSGTVISGYRCATISP